MLKLFVCGYSYGVKSSRKLERSTDHNLSFIWLMGGFKPDHKTIAEFRRKNKNAMATGLKQCARMCIQLELIAGNILFVDGTKLRANASTSRTHDKAWEEDQLKNIDHRIESLLQECEKIDPQGEQLDSFVSMDKELTKAKNLKRAVKQVLSEFKKTERKKIHQTDPDCANMSGSQGKHASYNVQSVVDDKNGQIVHAEAVNDVNDLHPIARQVQQSHEVLKKPSKAACADAGYADTRELEKIDAQGTKVIVPSQRKALHTGSKPFCKQGFSYDKEQDCHHCPERGIDWRRCRQKERPAINAIRSWTDRFVTIARIPVHVLLAKTAAELFDYQMKTLHNIWRHNTSKALLRKYTQDENPVWSIRSVILKGT